MMNRTDNSKKPKRKGKRGPPYGTNGMRSFVSSDLEASFGLKGVLQAQHTLCLELDEPVSVYGRCTCTAVLTLDFRPSLIGPLFFHPRRVRLSLHLRFRPTNLPYVVSLPDPSCDTHTKEIVYK